MFSKINSRGPFSIILVFLFALFVIFSILKWDYLNNYIKTFVVFSPYFLVIFLINNYSKIIKIFMLFLNNFYLFFAIFNFRFYELDVRISFSLICILVLLSAAFLKSKLLFIQSYIFSLIFLAFHNVAFFLTSFVFIAGLILRDNFFVRVLNFFFVVIVGYKIFDYGVNFLEFVYVLSLICIAFRFLSLSALAIYGILFLNIMGFGLADFYAFKILYFLPFLIFGIYKKNLYFSLLSLGFLLHLVIPPSFYS